MRPEPGKDSHEPVEIKQSIGQDGNPRSTVPIPAGYPRETKFGTGDVLANRFLIIRFVGCGGMGEVYEAEDRLLQGARVALKTISLRMAADPSALERFEREVLLARQVTHPNVCPIYDICYHEGRGGPACFLTMKLLPGETLAARLAREGKLAADEALPVVRQIAAALHAAHGEGIVHRDVKPGNIMVDGSGPDVKAVVTDFGLARKHNGDITISSGTQILGTRGYLAPELVRGHPATAASDLYAFGVVVHQIFGGELPSGHEAYPQVKPNAELRSSRVPSFIAPLVTECLRDDPQKRCRAFENALRALEITPKETLSAYGSRRVWSRRQMAGAVASAGCALAVGLGWKWDEITDPVFRPLPRKRFVALVSWPPPTDNALTAMLSGIVDAIERELSRAEAFDHDLLVLAAPPSVHQKPNQLNQIRESLGANLVLASSATSQNKRLQLSLKIVDPGDDRTLRHAIVFCGRDEVALLPEKAVRTAAQLLGVSRYVEDSGRLRPSTKSAEAYQAFQAAEALRRQPNDTGLDAAIEQYKTAVEHDDRYALAYAKLGLAYCRLYGLRHEPAALELARANANTALELDKSQDQAHSILGYVLANTGHRAAAIVEMEQALRIDPTNARTMVWQAQVYIEMNQLARAEEMFRRVLKARPNYWLAYNELGTVFETDGKYTEALQAYRTANLAQPKNALPLSNMGSVLIKLGRLDEAKESLQKSLGLKPIAWAAANMAWVFRVEGRSGEALPYGLKAVELDSTDEQNWLELGACYDALAGYRRQAREAYGRAAQEAERHLQIDASDGPSWMRMALCQAKSGKPDDALATARKAESMGATELDSQIFKTQILELANQREEALGVLAGCFRQGATRVQIASIADLQSLRGDPRYLAISNSERAPSSPAAHPRN